MSALKDIRTRFYDHYFKDAGTKHNVALIRVHAISVHFKHSPLKTTRRKIQQTIVHRVLQAVRGTNIFLRQ